MEKKNSAMSKKRDFCSSLSIIVFSLIFIMSVIALYYLCLCLVSQIYYQRAKQLFQEEYYGLSAKSLEKAYQYQTQNFRILKQLGKTYYKLGLLAKGEKQSFFNFIKAREYYSKAYRLNPQDSEAAYGIAIQEAHLEKLYGLLYPSNGDQPYQALPYFYKAIDLWPNSIIYRYTLARYLYDHRKIKELSTVIQTLCSIYPPAYRFLKNEPLWSIQVSGAVKRGLEDALDKGILVMEAHRGMSYLMEEQEQLNNAIFHLRKALSHNTFRRKAGDYFHLGYLYLKNRQIEEAGGSFLEGLDISQSREKDLERLYHIYRQQGYHEELYQFFEKVRGRFILSYQMDILTARSLIDLQRLNQAKSILIDINNIKPTADAYYWLARIARIEGEWEKAEIAAQKATVLEPAESKHHSMFSLALTHLKKLDRAEEEAGKAIRYSEKPYPWLYTARAWVRCEKKEYEKAAIDLKMAIKLAPGNASLYAQAAECYVMLKNFSSAVEYYKKANIFDPTNENFKKRYNEINANWYRETKSRVKGKK